MKAVKESPAYLQDIIDGVPKGYVYLDSDRSESSSNESSFEGFADISSSGSSSEEVKAGEFMEI